MGYSHSSIVLFLYFYFQDNLQTKANLIQAQHAKYGPEFMQALIDEYDNTNNNLLNKGTTFSKSIINQVWRFLNLNLMFRALGHN